MSQVMFILYVADQASSEAFYSKALQRAPTLSVPGMTEFALVEGASLGLMPADAIRGLLGEALPDPSRGAGIPRAEIYVRVDDAGKHHGLALQAGARELSALSQRGWGDRVAYCMDADGHVIAFAESDPGS